MSSLEVRSQAEMHVLVVGCGSIGLRHLRNLRTLGVVRLSAFDVSGERLAAAADEAGASPATSLEAALAAEPDAVLICTPPHRHLALATAALEAGAHVFVEKPIAHCLDGVDGLLDKAAAAVRLVCVGYNLRFHAGLRTTKALIECGALGHVLAIRAEFGQYLPDWRPHQDYRVSYTADAAAGGGIILDASHELDYVRWLGGEVESVYCAAGHLSSLQMDAEDTAAITLRLSSGIFAGVHLDCVQRGYARNCKIVGEDATLVWDFREGVRLLRGTADRWEAVADAADPNDMYVDEMRHFLACVCGEAEVEVDGATGRRVLEIALAAKLSAQSRREVRV